MASFNRLLQLAVEQPSLWTGLEEVYMDFPRFIRQILSEWIEAQDWQAACDDPALAQQYFNEMLRLIDNSEWMEGSRRYVQRKFEDDFKDTPTNLARIISAILVKERSVIDQLTIKLNADDMAEEAVGSILSFDTELQKLEELKKEIEKYRNNWADISNEIKRYSDYEQELQATPYKDGKLEEITKRKSILSRRLQQYRSLIQHRWIELFKETEDLLQKVLKQVQVWRRFQELVYVKAFSKLTLEQREKNLHEVCGKLGLLIYYLNDLTAEVNVEESIAEGNFQELRSCFWEKLTRLLQGTVVMIKQPSCCQKITSSTDGSCKKKFEVSVAIWGAKYLRTNFTASFTSGKIFAEAECKKEEHLDDPDAIQACKMEWNINSKFKEDGTAVLEDIQLSKFNRPPKDDKSGRVCQKRCRLLFRLKMTLNDKQIQLRVMSLPFILNTGANQTCEAQGALLWYLYPKSDEEEGCHYAPPFPWKQELPVDEVMEMLNAVVSAFSAKRPLRQDEKDYLISRLTDKGSSFVVTIDQFLFDKIAVSSIKDQFPFWKWFTAIINLIENYLLEPWKDNVIYGFTGDAGAREELARKEEGAFLLRFSESYVVGDSQSVSGALVPTVRVARDIDRTGINSVHPLDAKFFDMSSLSDLPKRVLYRRPNKGTSDELLKMLYTGKGDLVSAVELSRYTKSRTPINQRYQKFMMVPCLVERIHNLTFLTLEEESTGQPSINQNLTQKKVNSKKRTAKSSASVLRGSSQESLAKMDVDIQNGHLVHNGHGGGCVVVKQSDSSPLSPVIAVPMNLAYSPSDQGIGSSQNACSSVSSVSSPGTSSTHPQPHRSPAPLSPENVDQHPLSGSRSFIQNTATSSDLGSGSVPSSEFISRDCFGPRIQFDLQPYVQSLSANQQVVLDGFQSVTDISANGQNVPDWNQLQMTVVDENAVSMNDETLQMITTWLKNQNQG